MPGNPAPSGTLHPNPGAAFFWDVIENKDFALINNRQAGRRRGRNNPRPQGNGRGGDSGNRIDNRARGNAAQLLEKYKNLARDAQTQGDRVNTEYYLQFAEHYFRVLADNRARQEEQQSWRRNRDDRFDLEDDEDLELEGEQESAGTEDAPSRTEAETPRFERRNERQFARPYDQQPERQQDRAERPHDRQGERSERGERGPRRSRRNRDDASGPYEAEVPVAAETSVPAPAEPVAAVAEEASAKSKRAPRAKRVPKVEAAEDSHAMDATILPPSISRADNDSDEEEAPARKRTRRTRPAAEAAE